jgi:maleate cis-trans isomerase
MYGQNGRIGLLVPSVNTVVEPEFGRLVPDGMGVYAARMRNSRSDVDDSKAMLQHVERAADELSSAHVDVIAFACTASSFVEGVEGEIELRDRMERAGQTKAVTTSGSVAAALRMLGIRRVVVATPYLDQLNVLEKGFLEDEEVEILSISGMGIVDAFSIGKVTPQETYEFARRVWRDDADGMFISCTNLRTIDVLARLEDELGKPVVSSNSATCWGCLRALGCQETIEGYGRLLVS